MWSAAAVLVCALDLMGRSASSFPPILLVDTRPPDVDARAEAFVRTGTEAIYVLTSSATFRRAQQAQYKCGELNAVRKIASMLVHEEWHVRNGSDERGAYDAQLMALTVMGARQGTPVYAGVERAMKVALASSGRARTAAASPASP